MLGPLLFIIYINDIHRSSTIFQYILFADDTNLFLQHQNLNQMIQIANQEIKNVSQWLDSNKLTLTVSKTKFMIFKTTRKKINMPVRITIKDKLNKEQVKSAKFRGIRIDENMTWKSDISFITNKISKLSGVIAKLRHYLDINTVKKRLLHNDISISHIL